MEKVSTIVTDEERRKSFQARLVYVLFALIALVMSVINIITSQTILLIATSSFCVLCLLDFILARHEPWGAAVASWLFMLEVIILFSYFIITGGTDGFSTIWLLMLPTIGIAFFGFREGTVLSVTLLLVMMAIFHWTPVTEWVTRLNQALMATKVGATTAMKCSPIEIYGKTFVTRFPVVYCCCYAVSLLLEAVRYITSQELAVARKKYEQLYNHDALTGLYNRHVLKELVTSMNAVQNGSMAVMIMDIDFFKHFNDTYGHLNGDVILRELAHLVEENIPKGAVVLRWGGEEFAAIYPDGSVAEENVLSLLELIRAQEFNLGGTKVHITVSAGLTVGNGCTGVENFEKLLAVADDCLYQAKKSGRDRAICRQLTPEELEAAAAQAAADADPSQPKA